MTLSASENLRVRVLRAMLKQSEARLIGLPKSLKTSAPSICKHLAAQCDTLRRQIKDLEGK